MGKGITFIGLDVHKATIAVAMAESGLGGEARAFGVIANGPLAVGGMLGRLERSGRELRFCYEAGPCGYGLHRQIIAAGHGCTVVAPALIPRRAGDRVKTDRRDAMSLARLHRAGELTGVWVPDAAHEAMRDLVRARRTAMRGLRRARQHLAGFLLRHGQIATAKPGTLAYRRGTVRNLVREAGFVIGKRSARQRRQRTGSWPRTIRVVTVSSPRSPD